MPVSSAASLPVVMYHYVNDDAGGITVSPARFEDHCRVLAEHGWRGVGLAEAEAFFLRGESLPARSVLLTFDDGFLDNYQIALPLLARYGHQGTVFAVSNRLEAGEAERVPLADALSGRARPDPGVSRPLVRTAQGFVLRRDRFMNRAEIRAADREGTLRAAAHSRGHYGVFTGPEFSDFFRPRDMPRTFYRTEAEPVWGLPDFTVRAGLKHRAFIPEPRLVEEVRRLVPQDHAGAAAFFSDPEEVRALRDLADRHAGRLGRFESDAERRERMIREIVGGKEELEAVLGRPVHTLCWPWGEYCEEALGIAREAGFSVLVTTREGVNRPGEALAVRRFKGKARSGAWLLSRARVYARPLLGALYARMRL